MTVDDEENDIMSVFAKWSYKTKALGVKKGAEIVLSSASTLRGSTLKYFCYTLGKHARRFPSQTKLHTSHIVL